MPHDKKMRLIIAILLTTLIACGQITKSTTNKSKIDLNDVDNIEIRLQLYDTITVRMTDLQTKEFVTKWNNSKSEGLCKYMPKLWLAVSLTNGTTRTFRANGENIKEDSDWCFSVGDKDFFEHLWTEGKKE